MMLVNMLSVDVELDGVNLILTVEMKESNRFMVPRLAYKILIVRDSSVSFTHGGTSHTRLGHSLANSDDDSMVIVSTTDNVGRRSLDRVVRIDDVAHIGNVRVHIISFKLGYTVNVNIQTRDLDMDVLIEDVFEAAEIEHRAGAAALDMLMERLLGEESLNFSWSRGHCKCRDLKRYLMGRW